MTCLYVAPHLDDVALSCAGGLLTRTARGERVVVCTVFTRGSGRRRDSIRRREDRAALLGAKAEYLHLDFEDAPSREGIEPSFRGLILEPVLRPALVSRVERALRDVVRELRPSEVWLPLGIGGHIDHRTVFAARGAVGDRARFYEERPYAFVPALRQLRRLELMRGRLRAPPGRDTIAAQLRRGACGALFPEREERYACAAELAMRLVRTQPGQGLVLKTKLHLHKWPLLGEATALIEAYRTETRWLFGGQAVIGVWGQLAARPGRRWFEREMLVRSATSAERRLEQSPAAPARRRRLAP